MNGQQTTSVTLGWVFRAYLKNASVIIYSLLAAACIAALLLIFNSNTGFSPGIAAGNEWHLLVAIAIGWGSYLFQEYVAHVWIFHMPAPKNPTLYRLLYHLHMGHHDMPKRLDILITPIWFTLPVLLLNIGAFYLVTDSVTFTLALTLGLTLGYLEFEWFHLLVHAPYPCRSGWLKFIQKRHLAHHYLTEKRWFTVTPLGSLLDDLFFTGGSVEAASPSSNPKNGDLAEDDPRLLQARAYYNKDLPEAESAIGFSTK